MVPSWLSALLFSGFLLSSLACPEEPASDWARLELTTVGESKELFCQVIEGCQVTWKKDGKDFPAVDGQYEYRCGGRQLLFIEIVDEDAGNYTCYAESCNDPEPQTFELRVYPDGRMVAPVNKLYTDCTDKAGAIGENVTFCCLFYVGKTDFTFSYWLNDDKEQVLQDEDAKNSVIHDNSTEVSCITVAASEGEYGNDTTYGNYTVTCSSGIDPNSEVVLQLLPPGPTIGGKPAWHYPVIGAIIGVVVATVLVALLYWRNMVEIQLACKDKFGAKEENDGKMYDVYISYYWSDTETTPNPDRLYAIDLSQRLGRLGYKVCLPERDFLPIQYTVENISQSLVESRRYIILLSPDYLRCSNMTHETDQCLDIVKKNKKHIIPLFLRDIENDEIEQRTILDHIVQSHPRLDWRLFEDASPSTAIRTDSMRNDATIDMDNEANGNSLARQQKLTKSQERVWKAIRLQMPPVPRHTVQRSFDIADDPVSNSDSNKLVSNGEVCYSNVILAGSPEHRAANPLDVNHEPAHHDANSLEVNHDPAHHDTTQLDVNHDPAHHDTNPLDVNHDPAHHNANSLEVNHDPAHHNANSLDVNHDLEHHAANPLDGNHESQHHAPNPLDVICEPAHHNDNSLDVNHDPAHHDANPLDGNHESQHHASNPLDVICEPAHHNYNSLDVNHDPAHHDANSLEVNHEPVSNDDGKKLVSNGEV